MKAYECPSENNGRDAVNEPPAEYEVSGAASAELERYRAPDSLPAAGRVTYAHIPRDEKGNIIGTPWEEVLEELYDDLSVHYGVDLRTL